MKQVLFLLILTGCLLCHHVSPGYSAPTIEVRATSLELTGDDQGIISTRAIQRAREAAEAAAAKYFNDVGFIHLKKENGKTADFLVELKLTEKLSGKKNLVYSDATMYYAETKEQIITIRQAFEVNINDDINFAIGKACRGAGRQSAKIIVNKLRKNPDRFLNREYQLVFTGFEDKEEDRIIQSIKALSLRDNDIKDIKEDVQRQGRNPLTIPVTMGIYKKLPEFVGDLNILLEGVNIKVTIQKLEDDIASLVREGAGEVVVD